MIYDVKKFHNSMNIFNRYGWITGINILIINFFMGWLQILGYLINRYSLLINNY